MNGIVYEELLDLASEYIFDLKAYLEHHETSG
jgi:hypothetical protein